MDIKTAKERHKKLWGWLAETGSKKKADCPEWQRNCGKWQPVRNYCFACEIAEWKQFDDHSECSRCPIEWPNEFCETIDETGLFDQWRKAYLDEDLATRKALAAQIRDLPWKEEL